MAGALRTTTRIVLDVEFDLLAFLERVELTRPQGDYRRCSAPEASSASNSTLRCVEL